MVLPVPVPASARRTPPSSMTSATARAIARWPGRGSNSGNRRAPAGRRRRTPGRRWRRSGSRRCRAARFSRPAGWPSASILSTRRWWRPPANGVSRKMRTRATATSAGEHAGAEREDVGVVVLAREAGRLRVPRGRGPDARDLVGGHRHADAGAADEDAAVARPRRRRGARRRPRSRGSPPTRRCRCRGPRPGRRRSRGPA